MKGIVNRRIKSVVTLLLAVVFMFLNTLNVKGETRVQTKEVDKRPTTDTFKSLGGDYSLSYLLRNYGVVSFKDITGSHVVGPIIAKERVFKTDPNGNSIEPYNDTVVISDLSFKVSSFVGIIEKRKDVNKPTFEMNHGYNSDKTVPNLYTNYSNVNIWRDVDKYQLYTNNKETSFLNPNNGRTKEGTTQMAGPGAGEIFQNDSFIDFVKAKESIRQESTNLAARPGRVVSPESTGYLRIDAGSNYIINDASNLKIIDIRFPAGYDGVTKLYPHPTFINITGNTLVKSGKEFKAGETSTGVYSTALTVPKINNEEYQFLPDVYVNGVAFNGNTLSETGMVDYGERMNIVWNLPNIKTEGGGLKVSKIGQGDILGHLIAPDAQIFNYAVQWDGSYKWSGGNINGAAIVDSWYGGKREVHYWPYKDDFNNPNFKGFYIKAKKNLSGKDLIPGEYSFSLSLVSSTASDGIVSPNFPSRASNKSDGTISFNAIEFSKEGTYIFNIKEVIGNDIKTTYDKSEYKLTAIVSKDTALNDFNVSYTIDKIIDANGGSLENNTQRVNEIEFNNSYDFTLPETGGEGEIKYLILGITLILSSILAFAWKKI